MCVGHDRCGMNWIAGNVSGVEEAARARRSAGALRKHVAVDSLGGHRQDRLSAGLHPRYVFKKVSKSGRLYVI